MQPAPQLSVYQAQLEDELFVFLRTPNVIFAPCETHLVYYVFLPSGRSKNELLRGCQLKLKRSNWVIPFSKIRKCEKRKENPTQDRIQHRDINGSEEVLKNNTT